MRKIQLFGTVLLGLFVGCVAPTPKDTAKEMPVEAVQKAEEKIAEAPIQPVEEAVLEGKIECRTLTAPDADAPKVEIAIVIGKERHVFGEVTACTVLEKGDYAQNEVPKEAVSAAGGWWAGGGDYFYLLLEKDEYVLMQGWQDEMQEDDGFHYEEVARYAAY